MSTAAPPTSRMRISTDASNRTLDWRSPFWTLTVALVIAGAVSVLRMVFARASQMGRDLRPRWNVLLALLG
jgi:hypothetical protein